MWFPNRSDTNWPVQSQKQARGLKFRIYKVEELYYTCSENKGADQRICVFVFTYADCWFSHEAAHIISSPDEPHGSGELKIQDDVSTNKWLWRPKSLH